MGGGGAPSHTTSTVSQSTSNLPEYARPYYESLMKRGQEESLRPYQTYENQRLAGMSGDTAQGLGMATNFARSGTPQLTHAIGAADRADQASSQMLGYNSQYQAGQGGNFSYQNINPEDVSVRRFDQAASQEYMSPYMEDVIARARQDVMQTTMEEQALRNADAAASGAFGGSRAAVQNQMAIGQAQDRMMDLTVQGRQAAFENAQQQFERDRSAQFGADTTNLQAQMDADRANQQADLETQQLGEQSRQFDEGAAQREEELRQSGRASNLAAIEAQQRNAGLLADLQSQRDKMVLDRIQSQLGVGQTREDYRQEQLDLAYQDFVNQRDAERQNLQFLSSLLQGVPISANQDVMTTQSQPTNPLAGALGTAGGLQALYQLGNN